MGTQLRETARRSQPQEAERGSYAESEASRKSVAVMLTTSKVADSHGDLAAATNPKVLRVLARISCEVTARYFQRRAADSGTIGKTQVCAITYRFGSSLNLQLHLHVCVFDGVFVERDNEALHFSPPHP